LNHEAAVGRLSLWLHGVVSLAPQPRTLASGNRSHPENAGNREDLNQKFKAVTKV
jgi:hypothetical protein